MAPDRSASQQLSNLQQLTLRASVCSLLPLGRHPGVLGGLETLSTENVSPPADLQTEGGQTEDRGTGCSCFRERGKPCHMSISVQTPGKKRKKRRQVVLSISPTQTRRFQAIKRFNLGARNSEQKLGKLIPLPLLVHEYQNPSTLRNIHYFATSAFETDFLYFKKSFS